MNSEAFKMKVLYAAICFALALNVSSCSNDDDQLIAEKQDVSIKLKANKSVIEPFEDIKVSIDIDSKVISANYDSITWIANGVAYGTWSNPWYNEDDYRDARLTDYRIGTKQKAYAIGYKDGKVTSKDSIEYEVKEPKGDFFSINWHQSKKDQYFSYRTGLTPSNYIPSRWEDEIRMAGVILNFWHAVEGTSKEYVRFEFLPWISSSPSFKSSKANMANVPDVNDFDWWENLETQDPESSARYNMEGHFFTTYLKEIYGDPILVYKGNDIRETDLLDEYNKRFTYNLDLNYASYPEMIWETPTSYICLLRAYTRLEAANHRGICSVIAQPRY